jgi:hypothetical protein
VIDPQLVGDTFEDEAAGSAGSLRDGHRYRWARRVARPTRH